MLTAARRRPPMKPRKAREISELLHRDNPWRWWRLQHDMKWARKRLEKHGLDPEEIRWLL